MTVPPCKDQYDIFGAGRTGRADPDEAATVCSTCPVTGECLEQFAASTRPEFVPYTMTISGMSGHELASAMRRIRERAA